eukprot:scaffold18425_cov51-Phaeocystis_antarctica.AAC.1
MRATRRPRCRAGCRSMVKVPPWQCPRGAPGGSERFGTPSGRERPTGRPDTASGARASHLRSHRFRRPLTIQVPRNDSVQHGHFMLYLMDDVVSNTSLDRPMEERFSS